MFVELLPILKNRPVMLTVALVGDNAIRVNVIPKRIKDSDSGDDALTTPLTVTGSPDELDREFAAQVVGFTDAFVKLGSNLTEIEAAHATARSWAANTSQPSPVLKGGYERFSRDKRKVFSHSWRHSSNGGWKPATKSASPAK